MPQFFSRLRLLGLAACLLLMPLGSPRAQTRVEPMASAAGTAVKLVWDFTQGSKPATKFRIYRQVACTGTVSALAEVAVPATAGPYSYIDTAVLAGQSYCWRITAQAADGEESAPSNTAQFLVPATLGIPTNLRVTLEPSPQ